MKMNLPIGLAYEVMWSFLVRSLRSLRSLRPLRSLGVIEVIEAIEVIEVIEVFFSCVLINMHHLLYSVVFQQYVIDLFVRHERQFGDAATAPRGATTVEH